MLETVRRAAFRAIANPILWITDRPAGVLTATLGLVFLGAGLSLGWTNWGERQSFAKATGDIVSVAEVIETASTGALEPATNKDGEQTSTGAASPEKPKPKPSVQYIPTIRFTAANNQVVTFSGGDCGQVCNAERCRPGCAVNDTLPVRYDPAHPGAARVDTWWQTWGFPALASGLGALSLAFSIPLLLARPPATSLQELNPAFDEKLYDTYPLSPAAHENYAASLAARAPPAGLVATAESIAANRNPLVLCEFLAYMACLSYEKDDKKLEDYLKSYLGPDIQFKFFSENETEGFGFVYEDTAFIVMRGTVGWADWKRNFDAGWTNAGALQPKTASWTAPPRHHGFAEGWEVIREQVEAWVGSLPAVPSGKRRFIFSGHSLGGVLAFLGAYEFAKQGRDIAAVITFGAPRPGGEAFRAEYDSDALGLGKRTLRLAFDYDIVPLVQIPLGYVHVGREWRPEKKPLHKRRLLVLAAIIGFPFLLARKGLSNKTLSQLWAMSLAGKALSALAYLGPGSIMALAAHKMQRRYALALSIMSYQQIRALYAARPAVSATYYQDCYKTLSGHLARVRGCPPEADRFTEIARLPNDIHDLTHFRWLSLWYPSRSF